MTPSTVKIGAEIGEVTDISGKGAVIRIDDNLGRCIVLQLDRMDARSLAALARSAADTQARKVPR